MVRVLQQVVIITLLIFVVASFPMLISVKENQIVMNPVALLDNFQSIWDSFVGGKLLFYFTELKTRAFYSFLLLLISMLISIIFSLLVGIFLARFKLMRIFKAIIDAIVIIPDFIIILFAVMLGVKIYQWTGIRAVSFSPGKSDAYLWFPTLVLAIAPTFYLLKTIATKYYQISSEDYVRTAVAKGINVHKVNLNHIYPNIEPFIIADFTKALSLTVGNLFIVEFLLNVSGVTKFIFVSTSFEEITYGIFILFLNAAIVYAILRGCLFLFKKGFVYG